VQRFTVVALLYTFGVVASLAGHYSWRLSLLLALPFLLGWVALALADAPGWSLWAFTVLLCSGLGDHQGDVGGGGVGVLCLFAALVCVFFNRGMAAAFLGASLCAGAISLIVSIAGA
jgi:hypothetical protein